MSLAKLVISEPLKPTKHVLIDSNPFLIGRTDDCQLILKNSSISKQHAGIRFNGEKYFIEDLKSKNGTLVNGIPAIDSELNDHDLITIGRYDLTFHHVKMDQVNKDMEKRLFKFKSVLEFTRSMNAGKVVDSILDDIMKALISLTQADRGFLLLRNESGGLELKRSTNIESEEFNSASFQISRTAIEKAVETNSPIVLSDARNDSSFGFHTSIRDLGIKTLTCIPISAISNEVIGLLYADSVKTELEFTDLDIEVLESLASNAGIAIENARVSQEIQKLIQRTSAVLKEVDQKLPMDNQLQASVRDALASITSIEENTSTEIHPAVFNSEPG